MSVPWSFRELADIVSKQEFLEDLKEKLQVLLDDINQVTKRCTSWIAKTETITYLELRQYLTDKTSNYIQQCANLVCSDLTKEEIKEVSDKQSHLPTNSSGYKDEKCYKILEEEIINIQKIVKSLDKNYRKFSKESQESSTQLNKELHCASEFMSTLQTKIESLTQETHKSIQSQDKKIEDFSDDVDKRFEQIHLLVKQYKNDLQQLEQRNLKQELEQCQEYIESLKSNEKSLTGELEQCQEYIESLKSKEKSLTGELETSKQLIENGNIEIKRLQAVEETSKQLIENGNIEIKSMQAVEEKGIKLLEEQIQKVRDNFKTMVPIDSNGTILLFAMRYSLRDFMEGKELKKKVMEKRDGYKQCQLCHDITYERWYIPRLKEICKDCWEKELGI